MRDSLKKGIFISRMLCKGLASNLKKKLDIKYLFFFFVKVILKKKSMEN